MTRLLPFLIALFWLADPAPAHAGPLAAIVPIVIGALKVSAAIKIALTVVSTVAVSALQRAKQKKPRAPGITIEHTLTGGANSRTALFGLYCTAGSLVCPPMSHGQDGKTPNAFLTHVIAISDIPVDGLDALIVNGEQVPFGGADTQYGTPIGGKYAGKAWIRFYDGRQASADPYLVNRYSAFGGSDRAWSSAHVGRGVSYAILTWLYDADIYKGEPAVKFVVRGARLYDPRLDSTVGGSGAHRWADQTTWGFTCNNAVINYNILRGVTFYDGTRWGGECEAGDLPLSNWVAAMNVCDEAAQVAGGGTEPRYRCGYEVQVSSDEPADVIEELVKSCSGAITEVGGVYKMRAGGPALPTVFLTDDDFIVSREQDFDPFPGMNESFNGIFATFPHPQEEWNRHDAPGIVNQEYLAQDNGVEVIADIALPAVPYPSQVQRLMRAWLDDDRRWRRHSASLGPYAFVLEPMDTVSWTSARNGYIEKLFEVSETETNLMTLISSAAMREVDPSDYDWTAEMEVPDPPSPGYWELPAVQAVPGFFVEPYAVEDASGVGRRPALRASWTPDGAADATSLKIQVRVIGAEVLVADVTVGAVTDGETIISAGILPATIYEVRAKYQAERPTEWTSWLSVLSSDIRFGTEDFDNLADLISDAVAADEAIADAKADIEQLLGSMADVEADILAAGGDIATLKTGVEALDSQVTTQATAISNAEGNLSRLESTVSTLNASVSQQSTAIGSLEGNYANLSVQISAVSGRSIIANPTFAAWPVDQVAPTAWVVWGGLYGIAKETGSNYGGNVAFLHSVGPDAGGIVQSATLGPGYYVLDLAIALQAGNFSGAGVLAYTRPKGAFNILQLVQLGLAILPDASGNVNYSGGWQSFPDRVLQYSWFLDFTHPDSCDLIFHYMNNHPDMGALADKITRLHRFELRPASTAEIDAKKALPQLQASVTQQSTAIATLESTTASHTTTISSHDASITQQGQSLSSLSVSYSSLESTVSSQGVTISNYSTAITTLDGSVAVLFGRAGVRVDVDGRIIGWEINNNGTVGSFAIHADYFSINKPGGGRKFTYDNGAIRIYNESSVEQIFLGIE